MKKAILIVKKSYAFHRKTRNRQGYVVPYVFFDPIGKSKVLAAQELKMLESRFPGIDRQSRDFFFFFHQFTAGRKNDSDG